MLALRRGELALTFATVLVCVSIVFFRLEDVSYLIWNLFLAWIPIFFAMWYYRLQKNKKDILKKILSILVFLFWLFFYPNSIYMITDYIHLSKLTFYHVIKSGVYNPERKVIYSLKGAVWSEFFFISMAAFLACALGVFSLYVVHKHIKEKYGLGVGLIFVLIANCLCGYGLYIGRFIRFNSWDVLVEPKKLLDFFINNINKDTLVFSICFSILSLFIYFCFSIFVYIGRNEGKKY